MLHEHHILTQRTARYFTVGLAGPNVREIVYAFHGYGQLARRFAARLAPIGGIARLVVAPEGLSRFYIRDSGAASGDPRVGATWMTREDRGAEIEDQKRYLDALHAHLMESLGGVQPAVSLLGFSQGAATMARWLASGAISARSVVIWAGRLPPEIEPQRLRDMLRDARVFVVAGSSDELAPASEIELEANRLHVAGVPFERRSFDGGHELNADTLMEIFPTPHLQASDRIDASEVP